MLITRPIVLASALAMAALACATPTEPVDTVVSTVVSATRDANGLIAFEVDWQNLGAAAAYLPGCNHRPLMWLERRGAGGWEGFGGGFCLAQVSHTPVRVDPNETVLATVRVFSGDEGEYRAGTSVATLPGDQGASVWSASARVP